MKEASTQLGPEVPALERVQVVYKKLALAANGLNAASDELGQVISLLDKALKTLNLGIAAWVTISGNDACPPDGYRWFKREIGYAKVHDKWGITLKTSEGDNRCDEYDEEVALPFNDAPRWLRIESIGKIPDLLEQMVKKTEETTRSIKKKTAQASEIAQVIYQMAEKSRLEQQK